MNKIFKIAMISAITALPSTAKLVTSPALSDVQTLGDFTVEIRQANGAWKPVAVYPVKVDEVRDTRHHAETASMSYFDFDGNVDVRVISNREKVKEAVVRPLSYKITPACVGDTLTFTLDRPSNLSVEVNGDIFHNLHLFANPVDTNRPTAKQLRNIKKDKKFIYFAPGTHQLDGDTLRIPSGTTVYVSEGARVKGQLIVDHARDIRIYGRGEIHPEGRGEGIYIKNSRNIEIEGVIVTQIPVGASDSVRITNVKAISSYGWGDGMNVFASNNVSYDRVFCRNSDDCSTIYATRKGFKGGCRNILMQNSTLWADVAHPIMIGLHGAAKEISVDAPADTIQEITYRNIDILDMKEAQIDYQGAFTIVAGDNNVVRDITFDNIRVEDFRQGKLIDIRIPFNKKYCAAPGTVVENVNFNDISYNGDNSELSLIIGYDESRKVKGVHFNNLVINGVKIWDKMPGKPAWYKTGDMARIFIGEHVDDVTFTISDNSKQQ